MMPDPTDSLVRLIFGEDDLADLGPRVRAGRPAPGELRAALDPEFARRADLSEESRNLIFGAALLWNDFLEEAHRIAQEVESADGSLLHAIMHRREPDYSNAKYWFRRVGGHPSFPLLVSDVGSRLAQDELALVEKSLLRRGPWDPLAFVDLCEEAARGRPLLPVRTLQLLQKLELESFVRSLAANPSLSRT